MENKREDMFSNILENAKKSKLYKNKLLDVGDVKGLSDLNKLPITTKEELRDVSPYGNLIVDIKEVIQYHETSGTTGKSISTWLTKNDYDVWCEEMKRGGLEFRETDIVAIRYPYALSFPAHILQAIVKEKKVVAVPIDSRGVVTPHTRVINLLLDLHITIIACMPLELLMLAETAKQMGYDPKKDFPDIRAFYTAGELLTRERKKQIEKIWGKPIYDHYGLTECGMIAAGCEKGKLHIDTNNFYVEILNPQTKQPVKDGEIGIITITNLTLEAMPLIRYYTEDLGRKISNHNCICGNKNEIIEHYGRYQDAIVCDGKLITMAQLQNSLIEILGTTITPYWIIIKNAKRLIIKVETELNGEEIEKYSELLSELLSINCLLKACPIGSLFDRKKLLSSQISIKPKYMVNYSQNTKYYSTFDELLKGFGTF
ncbi:phenylacetate--CoA ligase family protein [Mediterraneibacter gnavus]|uniref:phenylacetate--CoA ligase family protein n=1 Tax=Mediterraneibacter gnavus TaxID=33038 RepID=UPI0034A1C9D8